MMDFLRVAHGHVFAAIKNSKRRRILPRKGNDWMLFLQSKTYWSMWVILKDDNGDEGTKGIGTQLLEHRLIEQIAVNSEGSRELARKPGPMLKNNGKE